MATKLKDIKSTNWQMSVNSPGKIADGIEDIRQCIQLILTTTKGSDPMRPFFGSDIWRFIDTPVNTAVANISSEIIDSVGKWEPRVILNTLIHNVVETRIDYELTATMIESGESTKILFYVDRQKEITPSAIGRAFSSGFDFGFS